MAIFSEVNAKESKKQEADKTEDLTLRIFFGVFFDGTSNNMIQRSKALAIRKKHTTGLFGLGNHHKYEQVQLDKNDAEDLDNQRFSKFM